MTRRSCGTVPFFGAITSGITHGTGLKPKALRNVATMRAELVAVTLVLALVGVILLIKAGFDKLEARTARGSSPKNGWKG
jgi:hypothetical protein